MADAEGSQGAPGPGGAEGGDGAGGGDGADDAGGTRYARVASVLAGDRTGEKVRLRGWVHRHRSSGGIVFLVLRDATGVVQVTVKEGNVPDDVFEAAVELQVEASVRLEGEVVADDRAPGGHEVRATALSVVGESHRFPIQEDQSTELLLDKRHLWVRSRELARVLQVKGLTLAAFREWFDEQGFTEVHPPILTGAAVEGGSTLFEVDYFGQPAYLSQSAQLYLEAMIFGLETVYSLTPSFRAEKSRTTRHLAEYWHLEGEMAWVGHEGNLEIQEALVAHACRRLAEEAGPVLEELGQDVAVLEAVGTPFPRITYREALDELADKGRELHFGESFGTEDERLLTEDRDRPLFVTHYPSQGSAFYMKRDPDDPEVNRNADLLLPQGYGEVIGGSERETDIDVLVERLKAEGEDLGPYEWYLDLRRFGSVPHSGFGLGVERFVRWACGLDHIRDAIPFPRTVNRVYP